MLKRLVHFSSTAPKYDPTEFYSILKNEKHTLCKINGPWPYRVPLLKSQLCSSQQITRLELSAHLLLGASPRSSGSILIALCHFFTYISWLGKWLSLRALTKSINSISFHETEPLSTPSLLTLQRSNIAAALLDVNQSITTGLQWSEMEP